VVKEGLLLCQDTLPMKQQMLASAVNIFFLVLFLLGTVLNLLEGDYAEMVGFFLLAISNTPPLLAAWAQREPTSTENIVSNVTGLGGLLLVIASWLGLL
jgi:hypothetical protein